MMFRTWSGMHEGNSRQLGGNGKLNLMQNLPFCFLWLRLAIIWSWERVGLSMLKYVV